ncbi:MAG: insulinase family protein [Thermoplasmata archaeon]|nr:insulinase family protein [Thermoplasmata archaeon]
MASSPLALERSTLDNGLGFLRQAPPVGAASFSVTYLAPAGWGYDPARQAGLARVVGSLLAAGAGSFDRAALARRLDALGGSLHAEVSPEHLAVTLWGPEAHRDRLLPLLVDAVLRPRFEAKELARVRRELAERQLRELAQPASRAEKELLQRIFARGHPLRETGFGSPGTLGNIDRAALRRHHEQFVLSNRSTLIGTSRASAATLARSFERAFKAGASTPAPRTPVLPDRDLTRRATARIDLRGNSQVEIRVGGSAIAHSDPEYPAAFLANEVLGGRSLLSRLFQNIRESKGLAYHTSSELAAGRWGGYWLAEAGTGPARAAKVLSLLRGEIRRMGRELVPPSELDRIRESTLGAVQLELEDTASAHGLAVEIAELELPEDHLLRWPDTLRAVTPAQLQSAAASTFDLRLSASVVAGPPNNTSAAGPPKPVSA